MKTFNHLVFRSHHSMDTAKQATIQFSNGYGVSVIKGPYSYGGTNGLYELAVLKNGKIHYDNSVAKGDVVGWLTPDDVTELMGKIQSFSH